MSISETAIISRRQKNAGPLHHLWNNHGHWWIHCTLHLPDGTAERIRKCLRTKDLETAIARRDHIFRSATRPLSATASAA